MTNLHTIGGMKVITHPSHMLAKRTLRERLFSLPWKPWQRTKLVPTEFLGGKILSIGGTLHMSQQSWEKLKEASRTTSLNRDKLVQ